MTDDYGFATLPGNAMPAPFVTRSESADWNRPYVPPVLNGPPPDGGAGGGSGDTNAFDWFAMSWYKQVSITPKTAQFPGYDTFTVTDWDGPGGMGQFGPMSHVYDNFGTYDVTLQVTDSTGALPPLGPFTETVPLPAFPPGGWVVSTGEGLKATFQPDLGTLDPYATAITWTWGDGSPDGSQGAQYTLPHTYAAAGTYQVVMHVAGKPDVPGSVTVPDYAGNQPVAPPDPNAPVLTSITPNSTSAGQVVTVRGERFLLPMPGFPQAPTTTALQYSNDNWATYSYAAVIPPHTTEEFTSALPFGPSPGSYQARVVTSDWAGVGPGSPDFEKRSNALPLELVEGLEVAYLASNLNFSRPFYQQMYEGLNSEITPAMTFMAFRFEPWEPIRIDHVLISLPFQSPAPIAATVAIREYTGFDFQNFAREVYRRTDVISPDHRLTPLPSDASCYAMELPDTPPLAPTKIEVWLGIPRGWWNGINTYSRGSQGADYAGGPSAGPIPSAVFAVTPDDSQRVPLTTSGAHPILALYGKPNP